jgi:hypothetical protein
MLFLFCFLLFLSCSPYPSLCVGLLLETHPLLLSLLERLGCLCSHKSQGHERGNVPKNERDAGLHNDRRVANQLKLLLDGNNGMLVSQIVIPREDKNVTGSLMGVMCISLVSPKEAMMIRLLDVISSVLSLCAEMLSSSPR